MAVDSDRKSVTGVETPASAPPANPLASDPELMNDFILESREHLTAIELQLLTLDQDPSNSEAIHAIFRGFHTIKGMAGFLDLDAVRDVAHEVETVLDLARNSKLAITSAIIDRILESKDYLNAWMGELESLLQTGKTPAPPEAGGLLEALRALIGGGTPGQATEPVLETPPPGLIELARELLSPGPGEPAAEAPAPEASAPEATEAVRAAESKRSGARSIKVETAKLDYLVDMVGEMVIAQSLVRHDPDLAIGLKPRLARNLSQLTRITDDVQRTAMSMRMIPVGQLFQKTSRLVRDLARKAGKQVELELAGEETELDRNIVEELADPLMHMVRNSVDHGIEEPEERVQAGKSPSASVTLKAGHQAGYIVIEVSDDGRGLPCEKILRKAREKNLIAADAELSESEIFALIFHPGFSTAEKITDVSGRGVGMDVVQETATEAARPDRCDFQSGPGNHLPAQAAADARDHRRPGGGGRRSALRGSSVSPCGK